MNPEEIMNAFADFRKLYTGDLQTNQRRLDELIDALSEIVDAVGRAKTSTGAPWKLHKQTLVVKIIFTSKSILGLSKGYSVSYNDIETQVIDYPSIFVLVRSLMEAYLTLAYIYKSELPEEEKFFRYKIWEVSGLIKRQNWATSDNMEFEELKHREKKLIDSILSEIKKMSEFQTLDKNKITKLHNHGLPRLHSWSDLIKQSNLSYELFEKLYSFFSSYSHSEYISVLQLSQVSLNSANPTTISNTHMAFSMVRMLLSLSIIFYTKEFHAAKKAYDLLPDQIKNEIRISNALATYSSPSDAVL